jgi:hypothetical protein
LVAIFPGCVLCLAFANAAAEAAGTGWFYVCCYLLYPEFQLCYFASCIGRAAGFHLQICKVLAAATASEVFKPPVTIPPDADFF